MDKVDKQFIDLGAFNQNSVDCTRTPSTAEEYLRQVVVGRRRIPDYTSYNVPKKFQSPTVAPQMKVEDPRAASPEWVASKCKDFGEKRAKLENMLRQKKSFNLPNQNDQDGWHELLFDRCIPELADEAPHFPNHIGTPPVLSLVLNLSQTKVQQLIEYIAEWAESEGFSRPLREWLYALVLRVDVPLLHDVVAALRSIGKTCRQIRSQYPLENKDAIAEISFFIAVISNYFGQKDLSD